MFVVLCLYACVHASVCTFMHVYVCVHECVCMRKCVHACGGVAK